MVAKKSMESATIMDLVLPRAADVLNSKLLARQLCLCPVLEGKEDVSLFAAVCCCSPQHSPVLVKDQIRSHLIWISEKKFLQLLQPWAVSQKGLGIYSHSIFGLSQDLSNFSMRKGSKSSNDAVPLDGAVSCWRSHTWEQSIAWVVLTREIFPYAFSSSDCLTAWRSAL